MAGASLLALLDDIATVLDDVAVMTKVAAQKTAGVLGDDLALNAQQVNGIRAERELPVVLGVAIGSLKNKLILVPAALAISALAPWAVMPLLMVGGLYLCLEGVEKLAHRWLHPASEDAAEHEAEMKALADESVDLVAFEAEKIKGAIRTDFVLSAEIIVIALGTVADKGFTTQLAVLSGVGLLMTIGVYGFVAGIVKLDDMGAWLVSRTRGLPNLLGQGLLHAAPILMRLLTVVGTAAMFIVGGGILSHGLPFMHALTEAAGALNMVLPMLLDVLVGLLAGALALLGMQLLAKLRQSMQRAD
jgi:predicted DNA repair protein MutK